MKLGKYDQKISFISQGTTADSFGGYTPTEIVELSTFARIEQLKVSGNIEQAQLGLPSIFRVGVQVRAGFIPDTKHMIKWRDKVYKILTAPVIESVRYNQEWIFDITTK